MAALPEQRHVGIWREYFLSFLEGKKKTYKTIHWGKKYIHKYTEKETFPVQYAEWGHASFPTHFPPRLSHRNRIFRLELNSGWKSSWVDSGIFSNSVMSFILRWKWRMSWKRCECHREEEKNPHHLLLLLLLPALSSFPSFYLSFFTPLSPAHPLPFPPRMRAPDNPASLHQREDEREMDRWGVRRRRRSGRISGKQISWGRGQGEGERRERRSGREVVNKMWTPEQDRDITKSRSVSLPIWNLCVCFNLSVCVCFPLALASMHTQLACPLFLAW